MTQYEKDEFKRLLNIIETMVNLLNHQACKLGKYDIPTHTNTLKNQVKELKEVINNVNID